MKHVIIGTAGHIDHGKTTLIKALTGMDTDRLKEEKQRGITIELGFASFTLPNGITAGVIDVPGHEKFVGNMVTGVTGMDLVLLLIAADEGVMPQTREHIAILKELGVQKGIVVLSKCDLVDDEWRAMIREEIREELRGSMFEQAPIAEISAVTGAGIPELTEEIRKMIEVTEEKAHTGPYRMPVDRVFSITGFGTVVTGTMLSGTLHQGDEVVIYPSGKKARVRGLQVYNQEAEFAAAGQRTAVNLAGVEKQEIKRGDVIAPAGSIECSSLLDVKLHHSSYSGRELPNRVRLHLSVGTDQVLCRAVWLDRDVLLPGESCYAQLITERPVAVKRRDRFIVRFYSPVETVGGGMILEANAVKRKRYREDQLTELKHKEEGTPEELLELAVRKRGRNLLHLADLIHEGVVDEQDAEGAVKRLTEQGLLRVYGVKNQKYLIHISAEQELQQEIRRRIREYHQCFPYRRGIRKAEVQTRFLQGMKPAVASVMLDTWEQEGVLQKDQDCLKLPGYKIPEDERYDQVMRKLTDTFRNAGYDFVHYADIDFGDIRQEQADDILLYAAAAGKITKLNDQLYTLPEIAETAIGILMRHIQENETVSVTEARDLLRSSRKNIKSFFEYMDSIKLTKPGNTELERVKG